MYLVNMKSSSVTLILTGIIAAAAVVIMVLMYQIWLAGPEDARLTEVKVQTQIDNIAW